MNRKLKIAVTGGIGGGKTAFCEFISEKGFPVLSADDISKEILVKNIKVREKITSEFGKDAYHNNTINKKFLAEKVFSSPSAVKKINSIVHPVVISEIGKKMQNALKNHQAVFVEAALIFEAMMEEIFDYIIVVTADENIRKMRAGKRGIDEAEFIKRNNNQLPEDKKRKKADFVFENNGTKEDLKQKAEMFINLISKI
jgi:dephospho-CoA kinase